MPIPRTVGISLERAGDRFAAYYLPLLAGWRRADFDAPACRRHLENVIAQGQIPEGLFDPALVDTGGRPATDALIYRALHPGWSMELRATLASGKPAGVRIDAGDQAAGIAELLRRLDDAPADEIRSDWDFLPPALLAAAAADDPAATWPAATRPGIYRREHASVLVRSPGACIVVDPVARCTSLPGLSEAPRPPAGERVDAVVITHGHGDHWDIASILCAARTRETPVIVPVVPRANLLTPAVFAEALASLGQRVIAAEWGSTVVIGDVEIDVLPFYGEQPTRDAPGPAPGLRSFGNCYRFQTPAFSATLLVDSGADPLGDMRDVMRASLAERGPVDVVLSSLRVFASPFFGGLPGYFLTLPFARLRALYRDYRDGTLPSTTAGPHGVAELCRAAGARWFLPYANGFEGAGRPITDVGWGQREAAEDTLLAEVAAALARSDAATRALRWCPGDVARLTGGDLAIEPASAAG